MRAAWWTPVQLPWTMLTETRNSAGWMRLVRQWLDSLANHGELNEGSGAPVPRVCADAHAQQPKLKTGARGARSDSDVCKVAEILAGQPHNSYSAARRTQLAAVDLPEALPPDSTNVCSAAAREQGSADQVRRRLKHGRAPGISNLV